MTTKQIIDELKRLPVIDLLQVIEVATQQVKAELAHSRISKPMRSVKERLAEAANALWQDYATDAELRAFSALGGEDFQHAPGRNLVD